MKLFKISVIFDNSVSNKTGEVVYLMQSDNIYMVKDLFLNNYYTVNSKFNITELGDLNFRLVWDIKDGYNFVGYLNNDNVVMTVKEINFLSPEQILFVSGNVVDVLCKG